MGLLGAASSSHVSENTRKFFEIIDKRHLLEGDIEALIELIQKGIDINAQHDVTQRTPLHCAVVKGLLQVVKKLIAKGALVNVKDRFKYVPLYDVTKWQIAQALITAGANINIPNEDDGNTPLHYAAIKNSTKTIEVLIAAGARVDIKNKGGWLPLHFAAVNASKIKIIQALLKPAKSIDVLNETGHTPLHLAVISGHIKIAEELLAQGARIDIESKYNKTLLASIINNNEAFKLFLGILINTVKKSFENEDIFFSRFNHDFNTEHNNVENIINWIMNARAEKEIIEKIIKEIETMYLIYQKTKGIFFEEAKFGRSRCVNHLLYALEKKIDVLEEGMVSMNIDDGSIPASYVPASLNGAASSSVHDVQNERINRFRRS